MHITFSESAADRLAPLLKDGSKHLKLLHDTEGCGCVVSGVPALQLISEPTVDDRLAKGEPFSFYFEPRHEVYYEAKMRVDYDTAKQTFSLKSDGQIYTQHLRLIG